MEFTISILGCGWLGLSLLSYLSQKGYRVKGSVTSEEMLPGLEEAGISPSLLIFSSELRGEKLESFFLYDVMIVNFPPERRPDIKKYLPAQIKSLITYIITYKVPKLLSVSSTAVYPDVLRMKACYPPKAVEGI